MGIIKNGLFVADISHTRHSPKHNSFKYKAYYLCFPISKILEIAKLKFLSVNKFNLFGFHEKDHGFGNKQEGSEWVIDILDEYKIAPENRTEIVLLTLPRILGYVFNPVSFWFCLDKEKNLRAVVSEVSNTFDERHCYISFLPNQEPITQNHWLESDKIFHVSPFLEVEGSYKFRFAYGEKKLGVWIDYYKNEEKILSTSMTGKREELSNRNLLAKFFRYPLLTIKVIALIHYQALKLFLKGVKYRVKPEPPKNEVSL